MSAAVETGLANRQTVVELVRTFEECEREIRASFAAIDGAQRRLGAAFNTGGARMDISTRKLWGGRTSFDFSDPEPAIIEFRRVCWARLIERLDLRRVMSVARWNKLSDQIEKGPDSEVPEITVENVLGMADGFRSQMGDMIRESVKEVYDFLRPHRSEYKSNSEFGIGKRVVLENLVTYEWGWRVNYYYRQHLTALENVFRLLDGRKHGTDGYYSELESAINAVDKGEPCRGETTYFRFRGHLKHTLHIEFTRPDLVALFNQVAGGGMLPQKSDAKPRRQAPADVLAAAVERARHEGFGAGVDANFFETPFGLADDVIAKLDLAPGMILLEPSAGNGALVRAALAACPGLGVRCIEQDEAHVHALRGLIKPMYVSIADFLTFSPNPDSDFDRVAMNPPFSHQRDILHVSHAFRFLKPDGVLVAIMSAGAVFRETKIARAFRELVADNEGQIRNNPPGSFKESGTNVNTVMVRMRRAA